MKTLYPIACVAALLIAGACSDKSTTSDDDDGTTTGTVTGTTTGTFTGTTTGTYTGTTTGTNTGTSTGSTDCGGYQISTEATCQTCAETNCCTELADCDTGTDCGSLIDCFAPCDPADDACIQACVDQFPDGGAPYTSLYDCVTAGCETECAAAGICGSDLSFQSVALTECVTASCCASFTPCYDDATCNACLMDPTTAGCDTNELYTALNTCMDTNCPTTICTTDIGFSDTTTGDPIFECNTCAGDSCCASLETCVGDGSEQAVDLCITCLQTPDDAACVAAAAIQTAANTFNTCVETSCATECGG
jgi:hypothetical protein